MSSTQAIPSIADRPTIDVATAAAYLGISERSMRRALDADLQHLAIRIGRRVLVRTAALLALIEGTR